MLVETSDIPMGSQVTTLLRYIHEGKIQERSVGFTDVGGDRSYDDPFSHVQNVVSKFSLESQLVAQMSDGVSVTSGPFTSLQHK
jgi:hypothetical protein